jgi:outer membrane protein
MTKSPADVQWLTRTAMTVVLLTAIAPIFAQSPPPSPDRPWHSFEERQIITEGRSVHLPALRIESDRVYSLAELIDLAEAHNPETRVAWEGARAQTAALGIARSAIFDFGARRGRINAESARLLGSNFGFNDVHRQLIFEVSQAYYRLLNAASQEEAAGASLVNAQAVQQTAEERLRNGLATLPDVLEARSATGRPNIIYRPFWERRKSREAIWQLPWERLPPREFACNR